MPRPYHSKRLGSVVSRPFTTLIAARAMKTEATARVINRMSPAVGATGASPRHPNMTWALRVCLLAGLVGASYGACPAVFVVPLLSPSPAFAAGLKPADGSVATPEPSRQRGARLRGTLIRPGDRLDVEIAGEPTLSGQFPVTDDGKVKLPDFIGVIDTKGLDTRTLADAIVDRAQKYLVAPTVVVSVVGRIGATVHVLGEVMRQGPYDIADAQ